MCLGSLSIKHAQIYLSCTCITILHESAERYRMHSECDICMYVFAFFFFYPDSVHFVGAPLHFRTIMVREREIVVRFVEGLKRFVFALSLSFAFFLLKQRNALCLGPLHFAENTFFSREKNESLYSILRQEVYLVYGQNNVRWNTAYKWKKNKQKTKMFSIQKLSKVCVGIYL